MSPGWSCRTIETVITVVYWVLVSASLLTMLLQLTFIMTLFFNHRRHLAHLARGDRRLLPLTLVCACVLACA